MLLLFLFFCLYCFLFYCFLSLFLPETLSISDSLPVNNLYAQVSLTLVDGWSQYAMLVSMVTHSKGEELYLCSDSSCFTISIFRCHSNHNNTVKYEFVCSQHCNGNTVSTLSRERTNNTLYFYLKC